MKFIFIFTASFVSVNNLFAAGNGHHGSVTDLIAPAVNVAILVGFLIYKLKKPLSEMFTKQAVDISNTLERASLKSKEAQIMYESEVKKLNNLESEIKNIHLQSEQELALFEKRLSKDTEEKIRKLKNDANLKIAADKKQLIDELNNQLLDQVIINAKSTIKSNKEYLDKTSAKLLKGL